MKKSQIAIIIILILILSGCSNDPKILSTTLSQIDMKKSGHIEQLHDYDSPYTICYQNKNGTYSMYIFASPIQFKTENGYEIIDNTVIESSNKNYMFENKANNIKTYFPKSINDSFRIECEDNFMEFKLQEDTTGFSEAEQQIFTNMYGDKVSAVVYERSDMNMVFYPTKAGIKSEIVLKQKPEDNQFLFHVTTSATSHQNEQNGYILFKNDNNENIGLIQAPLIKGSMDKYDESSGNFSIKSCMSSKIENNGYSVSINIDEEILNYEAIYPISFDPSFELYLNKQTDSGVYSKYINMNSYLRAVSVIGNNDYLGTSRQYLRLRLNYIISCDVNDIISSFYHIRELSGFKSNDEVFLNHLANQWSSTGLTWFNKIDFEDEVASQVVNNSGDVVFNITDYTKDCFADASWMTESYGLVLNGSEENNTYRVFASSDNLKYSPYVEMNLYSLPNRFNCRENINPTN